MKNRLKRVTIIQRILYQYRVDFYRKLEEYLSRNGIELQLIIEENQSEDTMNFLDLFNVKKNRRFRLFGEELIYQPYFPLLNSSDLIFLELGNRLLFNYIMMLRRFSGYPAKLAFWGHALNMQVSPDSWRNKFKKTYFKNVDWWFPYTDGMANILKDAGFPPDKMTTIYNATDTERVRALKDRISDEAIESLRENLNISNSHVGIFCGRIYKEKRMDFLLEACLRVREECPDFTMILIGSEENGYDYDVKTRFKEYPWIKYVGPAYGDEKVAYFKLADLFLSPGLVGLSITESFALEVPIITTDYPYHSPEIEYLKNKENGVITENNLYSYVSEILKIFKNREYMNRLREGCRLASKIYTMENMVSRLTNGIRECLELSDEVT